MHLLNVFYLYVAKFRTESCIFFLFLDRAHVDDVEKEVDDYIKCIDSYINALKLEIKARNHLISLLTQAETQLSTDKKDVKLVANVCFNLHEIKIEV